MIKRTEFHFPPKPFKCSVINIEILMKWEETKETVMADAQHHCLMIVS